MKKKQTAKAAEGIRSRIKEVKKMRGCEVEPNPANWRKHGEKQKVALMGVMKDVGDVGVLLAYRSKRNNGKLTLIDGHMRQGVAPSHEYMVAITDLNDEEADKILATHDPISAMAETDNDLLKGLLKNVGIDDYGLQGLLDELQGKSEPETIKSIIASASDDVKVEGNLSAFQVTSERLAFPSHLPYGIPSLREDMLADIPTDNLTCWIGPNRSDKAEWYFYVLNNDSDRGLDPMKAVMGFYTDDYKWDDQIWRDFAVFTSKLRNLNFAAVCTPDFSTYWEWTQAERIYSIYRARWCGRFWQEAGIKVIPSLQFAPNEMNFMIAGIPKKAPCLALQWQTLANDANSAVRKMLVKEAVAELGPKKLLVYCGEYGQSEFESMKLSVPAVFVLNRIETVAAKIKTNKKRKVGE